MFIKIREILLQRLESSPIKLENNNEVVVTSLMKQIHLLEAEMYMYITQAYPLRSWYVVNEPPNMDLVGFISELCLRSANCLLNMFNQFQDFFLKFHDYESGRDALNRWHFLSFLPSPPPSTHTIFLAITTLQTHNYISVCHFLKNLCFRGFHV